MLVRSSACAADIHSLAEDIQVIQERQNKLIVIWKDRKCIDCLSPIAKDSCDEDGVATMWVEEESGGKLKICNQSSAANMTLMTSEANEGILLDQSKNMSNKGEYL